LKEAHGKKDLAAIDIAMEKLNTAFQAAAQEMYAEGKKEDGQPQNENNNGQGEKETAGKGDQEVTDVDFEEVK
jgi:molecular chaperone DnaK